MNFTFTPIKYLPIEEDKSRSYRYCGMESLLLQRDNCTLLHVQLQRRLIVLETTLECFEKGAFWVLPSKISYF